MDAQGWAACGRAERIIKIIPVRHLESMLSGHTKYRGRYGDAANVRLLALLHWPALRAPVKNWIAFSFDHYQKDDPEFRELVAFLMKVERHQGQLQAYAELKSARHAELAR